MSEIIRLELKYCERCGGLLLRRAGLNASFCRPCNRTLNDLPPVRPLRSPADGIRRAGVLPFRPGCIRPGPHSDVHACCGGEQA